MSSNVSKCICIVACSALAGATLAGCASNSQSIVSDVNTPIVLPSVGDYPMPAPADYNIDLKLGNEAIDDRLMGLQPLPRVTFTIWGFDELAADVSATEIKVSEFELRPQAVPYFLRFSESDIQSIEYQSGETESLKYYVTMGVDVDDDGQVCNGDFRQDYTLSRPERFPVTLTEVAREIPISEVSGEICAE